MKKRMLEVARVARLGALQTMAVMYGMSTDEVWHRLQRTTNRQAIALYASLVREGVAAAIEAHNARLLGDE